MNVELMCMSMPGLWRRSRERLEGSGVAGWVTSRRPAVVKESEHLLTRPEARQNNKESDKTIMRDMPAASRSRRTGDKTDGGEWTTD